MEFVILCDKRSPENVREWIESRPGASIQWRDDDWRVSYGFGEDVFLDIMFLADFNSEPQWTDYLESLKSYINGNPDFSESTAGLVELVEQQKFALSILAEPAISNLRDERLLVIKEYLQAFGSIVQSPTGLFNDDLQVLCPASGQSFIQALIENCTLYFPIKNIPYKKILPGVNSDGSLLKSPTWYEYESQEGVVRINISKSDLDEHKRGFKAYVASQLNSGADRAQAHALIENAQCLNGIELPQPVSMDSSAFRTLIDLVKRFDGFMFVNDSIMLPDETYLVGPMAPVVNEGEGTQAAEIKEINKEDFRHSAPTEGVDPNHLAIRERHYCMLAERGFICARWLPLYRNEEGAEGLRPVEEVASRTLALMALFFWVSAPEEVASTERLNSFVERNGLRDWLTEEELEILDLSRAEANEAHEGSVGWKLENLWALCWILGFEPEPCFYKGQLPSEVTQAMLMDFLPNLDANIDDVVNNSNVRSASLVGEMEDLFYCTHNAVRSAQTGSADAIPQNFHPIIDGGAIHERRHSLTWAMSPGVSWGDTDLST